MPLSSSAEPHQKSSLQTPCYLAQDARQRTNMNAGSSCGDGRTSFLTSQPSLTLLHHSLESYLQKKQPFDNVISEDHSFGTEILIDAPSPRAQMSESQNLEVGNSTPWNYICNRVPCEGRGSVLERMVVKPTHLRICRAACLSLLETDKGPLNRTSSSSARGSTQQLACCGHSWTAHVLQHGSMRDGELV